MSSGRRTTRSVSRETQSPGEVEKAAGERNEHSQSKAPKKKRKNQSTVPMEKHTPEQRVLKVGDFLVPQVNWFGGRILVHSPTNVIKNLKERLTQSQKEIFAGTCFGCFIAMEELTFQKQLVHHMLLREVKQDNEMEMWFNVSDKLVRFSMEEFCLITGLKCTGAAYFPPTKVICSKIKKKYFGGLRLVYKEDVGKVFTSLPSDTDDEEVVKIGILYLLSSLLYTYPYHRQVPQLIWNSIDSMEIIESFPWGKDIFNLTFYYLKFALRTNNNNLDAKNVCTYRLCGFPLAFQVWIFETVAILQQSFCIRFRNTWPRILNWKNGLNVCSSQQLSNNIFDNVEVTIVEATAEEKEESPYYAEFYESSSYVSCVPLKIGLDDGEFVEPCLKEKKLDATPKSKFFSHRALQLSHHVVEPQEAAKNCLNEDITHLLADLKSGQQKILSEIDDLKKGVEKMVSDLRTELLEKINQNSEFGVDRSSSGLPKNSQIGNDKDFVPDENFQAANFDGTTKDVDMNEGKLDDEDAKRCFVNSLRNDEGCKLLG